MSVNPPDYEAKEKEEWKKNARKVIPCLDKRDKNLLKRIQTYASRFEYSTKTVERKIRADRMFRLNFVTEPRRQKIHEKIAAKWLWEQAGLNVEVLPQAGKDALYVEGGKIVQVPKEEKRKPSKALDFRWTYNGTIFYAMHKYTKESGGDQDNQFKEMEELLGNFYRATNPSNVLVVIVDGPYYTEKKIEELRNITRKSSPMSFAVHIEDIPAILKKHYE